MSSGKWYWEVKVVSGNYINIGIADGISVSSANGQSFDHGYTYSAYDGTVSEFTAGSGSGSSYGNSYTAGDVIGVALDLDNNLLYFYKNGTVQNSGTGKSISAGTYVAAQIWGGANNGGTSEYNFGQRQFAYTLPTGFLSLCTTNLSEPTVANGSTAMDVLTWTGNGTSSRDITNLAFNPDLVWVKNRSGGQWHNLIDSVRGASRDLYSNATNAEVLNDTSGTVSAFNSNGFTLAAGSVDASDVNASGSSYVGWTWDAGANSSKTYAVTVVSDSGNKYRFDGFGTSAVTLDLEEGSTYTFDQSDSSNSGHPLRFSTTSNGTHGGGSEYTTGVVTNGTPGSAGAYTRITVAAGAPTLYYYCSVHSGMGGQANTNSTAGASNFDGSIQSTVRANASTGFSVVTYSGSLTSAGNVTIGHGLGAAPSLVITKSHSATSRWAVFPSAALGANKYLELNATTAVQDSVGVGGGAAPVPTSTIFYSPYLFGSNFNGQNFVAYCFAPVDGYSFFGSYIGNGSADGPLVFTGFRPRWVMIKASSASGSHWIIIDAARDSYNQTVNQLYANLANAEGSGSAIDLLSNGFKCRADSYNNINGSGVTYIYAAFGDPFKTARAR